MCKLPEYTHDSFSFFFSLMNKEKAFLVIFELYIFQISKVSYSSYYLLRKNKQGKEKRITWLIGGRLHPV